MFLRRIYLLKRHELAAERAKLVAGMKQQVANPFASVMRVTDISAQLNQNAAADHELLHRFSWAANAGVRSI